MNENVWSLILLGGGLLAFLLVVSFLSKNYSLNNFKNKTVGDGQHGTARWAGHHPRQHGRQKAQS